MRDDPIDRAIASVAHAQQDPLAAASRIAELENATKASYTLIFNLVKRLGGGPLRVDRVDMLIPADEVLLLKQDQQGNVNLAIEKKLPEVKG